MIQKKEIWRQKKVFPLYLKTLVSVSLKSWKTRVQFLHGVVISFSEPRCLDLRGSSITHNADLSIPGRKKSAKN